MKNLFSLIRKRFNKNGIRISLYFVIFLILCNSILIYKARLAFNENLKKQGKYELIDLLHKNILVNLNTTDMSIRGCLLVRNEAFLDTYISHKPRQEDQFETLTKLLPEIGFELSHLTPVRRQVEKYNEIMEEVVRLDQEGRSDEALEIIKKDYGTEVWQSHVKFSEKLVPLLESKKKESQVSYDKLMALSLGFNVILFLIGIPTLLFASFRLRRGAEVRQKLYKELDESNRGLIFDNNKPIDLENEKQVIGGIIENLKKTAVFIKEIAKENFNIGWEGMNETNREKNKDNIAAELLIMRDQMSKKQQEVKRQNWASEGLNKLSEILRNHENDFQQTTDNIISFLVKYLEGQQGGLFIYNQEEEKSQGYLELSSCYAFKKKKFVEKRIEIGEGIIGQIYLEEKPIYITDIPEEYINISSGLGKSKPRCLVIYPLIQNEKVEAIVEIASFKVLDSFSQEFLASACKTIASFIASTKINEQTKMLLERSQQQAEEMRAQEEEMRQNMEELEATQEEMSRKETELRKLLQQNDDLDESQASK